MDDIIKTTQRGKDQYCIHFDNSETCQHFRNKYKGRIGHICCSGKGCKLPDVTSWKQIHELKYQFISPQ